MGEATESQCEQFALPLAVAIFPIFYLFIRKPFVMSSRNGALVTEFLYCILPI